MNAYLAVSRENKPWSGRVMSRWRRRRGCEEERRSDTYLPCHSCQRLGARIEQSHGPDNQARPDGTLTPLGCGPCHVPDTVSRRRSGHACLRIWLAHANAMLRLLYSMQCNASLKLRNTTLEWNSLLFGFLNRGRDSLFGLYACIHTFMTLVKACT